MTKKYENFKRCYNYETKFEGIYGFWSVYGEDPNCDLHGTHSNPHLGDFEGFYEDVVEHAVELQGFWQWGGGGSIRTLIEGKIIKIKTKREKKLERILGDFGESKLLSRKNELEKELKDINKKLKELDYEMD